MVTTTLMHLQRSITIKEMLSSATSYSPIVSQDLQTILKSEFNCVAFYISLLYVLNHTAATCLCILHRTNKEKRVNVEFAVGTQFSSDSRFSLLDVPL